MKPQKEHTILGHVEVANWGINPYVNKDENGYEVLHADGKTKWHGMRMCRELGKKDTINPDHYKIGGIETIDYLKAKLTPEQFKGYCLGNIIKYTSRHQYKNGEEDLKKSQWYMNKLLETLEG